MAKRHIAQIEVMDEDEVITDTELFFAECRDRLDAVREHYQGPVTIVIDEINSFDDDSGT
jgi:hypothetical protein